MSPEQSEAWRWIAVSKSIRERRMQALIYKPDRRLARTAPLRHKNMLSSDMITAEKGLLNS